MSNDPADKLAAPSFGFKKKRGATKPANTKPEKASAEGTQVLEKAPPVIAPERPADEPATKPAKKPASKTAPKTAEKPAEKPAPKQKASKPPKPAKEPKAPKAPREPKAPRKPMEAIQRRGNLGTPSGLSAAVMIGAVVGAFMALAVWFSGTVSQWTRGTSSLGDKGAIVLIAVFALAIIVGGYLLRLAAARSPFTISFLGSALVAVLSMLFLTDVFVHAWAVIIVVIISAAAYALAYWVTTTYID